MKNNKEIIMEYTGAMSRGILREKLDMLYSEQNSLDEMIEAHSNGLRKVDPKWPSQSDLIGDITVLRRTIKQLCEDASERKYRNMTIQQIQEKWDDSDMMERNDMLEFMLLADEVISDAKAIWDVNHYWVNQSWDGLDNVIKINFTRYAKSDSKKAIRWLYEKQ